jgi:hypothetical protein
MTAREAGSYTMSDPAPAMGECLGKISVHAPPEKVHVALEFMPPNRTTYPSFASNAIPAPVTTDGDGLRSWGVHVLFAYSQVVDGWNGYGDGTPPP